ncbi:MAG: 16S rRNA (cytidine(1402)-2'-O)-methyltransferase [Anaerolineales bacterium]|nr:16S rRNA (cytidine(1402)-2'-O)-methyltransferase [Anaerolineales bacterium]
MGTLFIVATPIGNLEDITLRALRVLREVSLIAAEDTRRTATLLSHYEIETRLISYHEHNKLVRQGRILEALSEGDVALVSDAGTPGLSDPGYKLVEAVLECGHKVSPIPGPSAPIAALVSSGLPSDRFLFLGYLPRRISERQRLLNDLAQEKRTMILFEVPHRLLDSIQDMEDILGGTRSVAVSRELTKIHEEILRGTLHEMRSHFSEVKPRGEFTLIIAGAPETDRWSEEALREAVKEALQDGMSPSDAAREIASRSGWSRRQVYKITQEVK